MSEFFFVVCQVGAESTCKGEVEQQFPGAKLAFSRPGFVTFKQADKRFDQGAFILESTFIRTWGLSLERITGNDGMKLAERVAVLAAEVGAQAIHVWQRDQSLPGDGGYEPFNTPLAHQLGAVISAKTEAHSGQALLVNRKAKSGSLVLDVVLVEPNEWWIGWHRVQVTAQQWPGGVPPQIRRQSVVSRAYYKMAETVLWGRLPIRAGDVCVELGSAPGGAAQCLLNMGAKVLAVDPAELDADLLQTPGLTHLRMRSREVPRNLLRQARWLFADLNVAPSYTLSAVEDLVKNRKTHFVGVGLTLKLTDWKLAAEIDTFRERVKSWGFQVVRTRQLAFNRREVCLVGLRDKFQARLSYLQSRRRKAHKKTRATGARVSKD